ncbi:hypothetical protein BJX99DRAFT_208383 [Aspergillus californicus]
MTSTNSSFRIVKPGKELQTFASAPDSALKTSLPSRSHVYDRVSVLAFHWENDDMGVAELEADLLRVFSQDYGYETESWAIPVAAGNPGTELAKKLIVWTGAHEGDQNLRIYVYSGHASAPDPLAKTWYFGGQVDQNGNLRGPQLEWMLTRTPLIVEEAKGDMAYIMDCCSAGAAVLQGGPEIMCASGRGQSASASLDFSFTRVLTDTLVGLRGEIETLAGIFAIIFRGAYANQVGACPVHVPKKNCQGIVLSPINRTTITHKRTKTKHRVLISVHLEDNQPNLEAWTKWLSTNLPADILTAEVKIESVFESNSATLLVTVPLEIWTMLDMGDEIMGFVSHVFSNNTLPALERNIFSSQLPYRPGWNR